MEKIDLIYIAGAGHSGSTLLDLILGSQKDIESLGEIIYLKQSLENRNLCTCGKIQENCEYWVTIIKEYKKFIETNDNNLFDMFPFNSNKCRLLFYIFNKPYFVWTKNEIERYGLKNYYLLRSIKNFSGKHIIVDSSKNVPRLLKLLLSGFFNIKIVYLFRDGRANMESLKRKAKDPRRQKANYRGALFSTIYFIFTHIANWRILCHIDRQNILVIRYKDFALHSKDVLIHICEFIGVDFQEETIDPKSSNHFSTITHHNTRGNRLRFNNVREITYKKKWTKGLNKKEKIIFQLLGGNIINAIFKKLSYRPNNGK